MKSLHELVADSFTKDVKAIARVLRGILIATAAVHERGELVQFYRPAHILISPDNSVLFRQGTDPLSISLPELPEGSDLNEIREAFKSHKALPEDLDGILAFTAPEAMLSNTYNRLTDIYAAGALGYWLIAGVAPFPITGMVTDAIKKKLYTDPASLTTLRSDCPEGLEKVIERAMRRLPEGRFQRAEEMSLALENFLASTAC